MIGTAKPSAHFFSFVQKCSQVSSLVLHKRHDLAPNYVVWIKHIKSVHLIKTAIRNGKNIKCRCTAGNTGKQVCRDVTFPWDYGWLYQDKTCQDIATLDSLQHQQGAPRSRCVTLQFGGIKSLPGPPRSSGQHQALPWKFGWETCVASVDNCCFAEWHTSRGRSALKSMCSC